MKTTDTNSLSLLLNKYDEDLARAKRAKSEVEDKRQAFTQNFISVRDGVIKPVFEQLKKEVEEHDHVVEIGVVEPSWDQERKIPIEPAIKFMVRMKLKDPEYITYSSRDVPTLTFYSHSSQEKIWVHESTMGSGHGGHAGTRGEHDLKDITEDMVRSEFLSWFESLVTGNY